MVLFATVVSLAAVADTHILSAFARLCASGLPSANAVLARADEDGWRPAPHEIINNLKPDSDRAMKVERRDLRLRASDQVSATGTDHVCSVSYPSHSPNLAQEIQQFLGFKPVLSLGSAATFLAVLDHGRWRSASQLGQAEFEKAQAQGRYYSIITSNTDSVSMIVALRKISVGADHAAH